MRTIKKTTRLSETVGGSKASIDVYFIAIAVRFVIIRFLQ